MGWYDLANNQTISFANLKDASARGVFQRVASIPDTNEEIIKTDVTTYVSVNTSYAAFSGLANNQLPVKSDLQANNGCSVTMPFFCQYNGTFPPPATIYDPTKDFAYTYNLGSSAGGVVSITLSGMTRYLQNSGYPGEVRIFYSGTSQLIFTNSMTCSVGGNPNPAYIAGGDVNPANRTVYVAIPSGVSSITVVVYCGGANANFTLSGTISISCNDLGWSCGSSEYVYFPPYGKARYSVSGPGDFNIEIAQTHSDTNLGPALSIYNSSGGVDYAIGYINNNCGTVGVSTTDSSYYEIRETSGYNVGGTVPYALVRVLGCPVQYVTFNTYGPSVMYDYSYYSMAVQTNVAPTPNNVQFEIYWNGDLGGYLYWTSNVTSGTTCTGATVYSGSTINPSGEYFTSASVTLDPSSYGTQIYQVGSPSTGSPPC